MLKRNKLDDGVSISPDIVSGLVLVKRQLGFIVIHEPKTPSNTFSF